MKSSNNNNKVHYYKHIFSFCLGGENEKRERAASSHFLKQPPETLRILHHFVGGTLADDFFRHIAIRAFTSEDSPALQPYWNSSHTQLDQFSSPRNYFLGHYPK
jgi:hypothetical protein